jgi:hypothetical protein
LVECVADEGARRRVVATHARMDVSNDFPAVGNGDPSLQDTGRGTLIQHAIDHSERLGFSGDAPGLGPIRGELPSSDPSEVFGPPILHAGGVPVSVALALSAPYPSSRESTNASVEGSSSMGSAPTGLEGAPEGSSRFEGAEQRLTDGLATCCAKTFGGMVIRPDTIFASSSASLLYLRGS